MTFGGKWGVFLAAIVFFPMTIIGTTNWLRSGRRKSWLYWFEEAFNE